MQPVAAVTAPAGKPVIDTRPRVFGALLQCGAAIAGKFARTAARKRLG